MSVIDPSMTAVVATVFGFGNPRGVAVSPDGLEVYVTDFMGERVTFLSGATSVVTGSVLVGTNPNEIAVRPLP